MINYIEKVDYTYKVAKAFNSNNQILILKYIENNPDSSVTEIHRSLDMEQPNCSGYLKRLKDLNLVTVRNGTEDTRQKFYTLDPDANRKYKLVKELSEKL